MVKKKIITAIGDEPTQCCQPIVVIPKENNEVRICVDLSKHNKHIERPIYPTSTPHDAITNVKQGSIYFTRIDVKHGYWRIPIEEKS